MLLLARLALRLGFGALTVTTALAQGCTGASPVAVAIDLYTQRHDFIHAGAESPPLAESLRQLVAANVAQSLQTGEVGAIDWDFWTDAQDGASSPGARAVLVHQRGSRATVRLQYLFRLTPDAPPIAMTAEVKLVRSGGCWLVDDLLRNGTSLRALLRRGTP